jgi:hypothetical protein
LRRVRLEVNSSSVVARVSDPDAMTRDKNAVLYRERMVQECILAQRGRLAGSGRGDEEVVTSGCPRLHAASNIRGIFDGACQSGSHHGADTLPVIA